MQCLKKLTLPKIVFYWSFSNSLVQTQVAGEQENTITNEGNLVIRKDSICQLASSLKISLSFILFNFFFSLFYSDFSIARSQLCHQIYKKMTSYFYRVRSGH